VLYYKVRLALRDRGWERLVDDLHIECQATTASELDPLHLISRIVGTYLQPWQRQTR
jgi:hypothetical protein